MVRETIQTIIIKERLLDVAITPFKQELFRALQDIFQNFVIPGTQKALAELFGQIQKTFLQGIDEGYFLFCCYVKIPKSNHNVDHHHNNTVVGTVKSEKGKETANLLQLQSKLDDMVKFFWVNWRRRKEAGKQREKKKINK